MDQGIQTRRKRLQRAIQRIQNLELYSTFQEVEGTNIANYAPKNKGLFPGTTSNSPTLAQPGGVGIGRQITFNGSNQNINWGDILSLSDDVTIFGIMTVISDTNMGNFPVIFSRGGNARYFLILSNTRRMQFNFNSSGGEKSAGATASVLTQGAKYLVFGAYDKDAGSNNCRLRVYGPLGTPGNLESNQSTQTLAISTGAHSVVFAQDPNRGYYMNVAGSNCGIISRSITDAEMLKIARAAGFA